MRVILHILDLISVFAFAFFGANAGIKQRFTFLGILVCAFLPALGGGTIREVILNHVPIYFNDYAYGVVVIVAAAVAFYARRSAKIRQYMYILDALGMAIFADLGAHAAHAAGLGLLGSVTFAMLTACGGGILCDMVTRQMPHAFKRRFYALPPLLLGILFWAMNAAATWYVEVILVSGIFALQLVATFCVWQKIPSSPSLSRRVRWVYR